MDYSRNIVGRKKRISGKEIKGRIRMKNKGNERQ